MQNQSINLELKNYEEFQGGANRDLNHQDDHTGPRPMELTVLESQRASADLPFLSFNDHLALLGDIRVP